MDEFYYQNGPAVQQLQAIANNQDGDNYHKSKEKLTEDMNGVYFLSMIPLLTLISTVSFVFFRQIDIL